MNAYNYNSQQWTSGQDAARLRLKQINNELSLLQSERGGQYAAMIGVTKAERIKTLEAEKSTLKPE